MEALAKEENVNIQKIAEKTLYCSFCNKSQYEVTKLIAGPSAYICSECVDLCNEIIRKEVTDHEEETYE